MTYPISQPPPRGLRLFGVEVNIDTSWLLFALFVGVQVLNGGLGELAGLTWISYVVVAILVVLGLSLSILLHELSHTLTGRAFGMRIDRITLHVFGGVAELHEEPRTAVSELLMALAGPAMSVLLWLLLEQMVTPLAAAHAPIELVVAVGYLATLNLILAIFNMIPAFPMDGGRVLRSLIWLFTGRPGLATRIAATLGQGFGIILILWGIWNGFTGSYGIAVWYVILGALLMRMATAGRSAAPRD